VDEVSQTAEELDSFTRSLAALYSRDEFRVFEKWIEEEIKSSIEKMLKGRKEETMRELAREVKTFRTVLNRVRDAHKSLRK
jgi:dsRNA-specific ribonuclease